MTETTDTKLSDPFALTNVEADIAPLKSAARDVLPVSAAPAVPAHLGSMPEIPGNQVSAIPAEELEQLTADIVGARPFTTRKSPAISTSSA
jgi:hypothetical protein